MNTTLVKKNKEVTSEETKKARPVLRPEYEVSQLEMGDYRLRVEIPGVMREDVEVSLEKDTLTIFAQRPEEQDDRWRPLLQEIPQGDYRLAMTLNVRIDENRISAHVEDGILTLDLPVAEEAKPREIPIK